MIDAWIIDDGACFLIRKKSFFHFSCGEKDEEEEEKDEEEEEKDEEEENNEEVEKDKEEGLFSLF